MKLARRKFLHLAAGAAALPFAPHIARAQTYPSRPVRVVAGFPPGGSNDLYARLIGQFLSERLGQQFIVENRPGAGGSIATDSVIRATPDGYTILLTASNDAYNTALYDNLPFDYLRDIALVAGISKGMGVLVVNPSSPIKSVLELIAYAKGNPGKVNIGSGGVGSSSHVFWALFNKVTSVDTVHIPYRGEGPAMADLIGGQVDAVFPLMPSVIEHIRAGKLRALAVTDDVRAQAFPDVPTIGDFVPGFQGSGWWGIGVPRNTPKQIIEKLNVEINSSLADRRLSQRIVELGDVPFVGSSIEFSAYVTQYIEKWGKVIRDAGIKA